MTNPRISPETVGILNKLGTQKVSELVYEYLVDELPGPSRIKQGLDECGLDVFALEETLSPVAWNTFADALNYIAADQKITPETY